MKLVEAQVVYDDDAGLEGPVPLRDEQIENSFPGVHKRVDMVESQYRDLWTFWIGLDRECWSRSGQVFRTLETRLVADCDKSFFESVLQENEDFRSSFAATTAVEGVVRTLLPSAEEDIAAQAALSGDPQTDRAPILHALHATIEAELGESSTTAEVERGQLPLEPDSSEARSGNE